MPHAAIRSNRCCASASNSVEREKGITPADIRTVIEAGEVIEDYPGMGKVPGPTGKNSFFDACSHRPAGCSPISF